MIDAGGAGREDRWIPWVFVAFFAVVVVANGTLAYLAYDSWTGLTATESYRRGLAYNQSLEQAHRQRALGWGVALSVKPVGGGRSLVAVNLRDRSGAALPRARVTLRFLRPTHEGYDRDLVLSAAGGGRYAGEVALPLPGQWDVDIRVELRGQVAQWRQRIETP